MDAGALACKMRIMAQPASSGPQNGRSALFRPALLLYVVLLASAAATLSRIPILEQAVREGRRPPAILMAAPVLLAASIVLFAGYRFQLVRAGHYHAGKAFVQVGFMVAVFLTLLLPSSLERYRAAGVARPVDLAHQLDSADPEARAVAAELARHRSREEVLQYVPRLVTLLEDPSQEVRRQARVSLVTLAGRDLGGDGQVAQERWRAYWRSQGVLFPER